MIDLPLIQPDWVAPPRVRVVSTTRMGGVSAGAWASLNLGDHVGDDPATVRHNRELLRAALQLPAEPCWLRQVHGCGVVEASAADSVPEADAAWVMRPGAVCAILTADCLPVVLAARDGSAVAAAHCGWRGLAGGVLGELTRRMPGAPRELQAWLGPAIGPRAFEVGTEVREAFLAGAGEASRREATVRAFVPHPHHPGKHLADLWALARIALEALGVTAVSGGGLCTAEDPQRFFSYRRDGVTGRMATLAWIDPAQESSAPAA